MLTSDQKNSSRDSFLAFIQRYYENKDAPLHSLKLLWEFPHAVVLGEDLNRISGIEIVE